LIAALVALAAGLGAAAATTAPTVRMRSTALGDVLVSASGRTLYGSSTGMKGVESCTGSCLTTWPPLLIAARAKPVAGVGVSSSLLGTLERPGGKLQITYRGRALYRFSGDTKAGELNGQGLDGIWHAVAPSGAPVTKSVKTSSPASSGASSSSGSSSMGSNPGSTTTPSPTVSPGMWCAANPKSCVDGVPVTGTSP
jgi:predicted lipoprotein with Yx(FWY)xxD motif